MKYTLLLGALGFVALSGCKKEEPAAPPVADTPPAQAAPAGAPGSAPAPSLANTPGRSYSGAPPQIQAQMQRMAGGGGR